MKKILLLVSILVAQLVPVLAAAEEVVVSTGATFIDKVFTPIKPHLPSLGISVKLIYGDPTQALMNLESGAAELAGASLALEEWLKLAEARGYTTKDRAALTPYVVIEEETVVVVHVSNRVTSLTKEQLQGLFHGRIQNWKDVGGTDAPVLVVWPRVGSGAIATFSKQVMAGSAITKEMLDVASINDTADAVASNPEAISIANVETVKAGAKTVQAPVLKRPLTLLTKGAPTPKVRKLLDFLQTAEARKAFK